MKVFVDVGANQGQTLRAIFEPNHGFEKTFCRYGFERIYCFEPVAELYQQLAKKYSDSRIKIYPFGLWKETCEKPVFSPGTQGGSIYADKINVDASQSCVCKFVRASDWFRDHLTDDDEVYLKLNCEGSEVDIIEDLLASNEYRKVASVGVTFDVRKIPSQRHREDEVKQRLKKSGFSNYIDLSDLNGRSRRQAIQKWLSVAGADRRTLANRIEEAVYKCQIFSARLARYSRRRLSGG